MTQSPREMLARLIEERGVEMAALSRMLGKNAAYIHQYIHRGSPKRLGEEERRALARYFGIDESLLGGLPRIESGGLVPIARRPVRAAAGVGALNDNESARGQFAFDPAWLRALTATRPDQLAIIRVEGDSMAPMLKAGDEILVDHADGAQRLRDGIYVLRIDDSLLVKRLAIHPFDRRVTIQSDNPSYPDWPDRSPRDLDIVGRVLWAGRKLD